MDQIVTSSPVITSSVLTPTQRRGPLIDLPESISSKDPCPVFNGEQWHIYATGWCPEKECHEIFHATAGDCEGPWTIEPAATLEGVNSHQLAAPGVVWSDDDKCFHMFLQTLFNQHGGHIEHLISYDGRHFSYAATILSSIRNTREAGIYDPHPAEIHGQKYITYSGFKELGQPEIYLAKSTTNTWAGPWERCGRILRQDELWHHNQPGHPDYEWGLEGAQLVELPNGQVLLNAVCFLPEGEQGTRQRVFFALSESPAGPFISLGPILPPQVSEWEASENGHATAIIKDSVLHLFYQARTYGLPWRFGHAQFDATLLVL